MSKKLKYILSVMLALVIMLAPMSAQKAKADEQYTYSTNTTWSRYVKGSEYLDPIDFDAPKDSLIDVVSDGMDTTGTWRTSYVPGVLWLSLDGGWLESLSVGEYTFTAVFEGNHTATFTVSVEEAKSYTYECTSGNGATYELGSGESITIIFDGPAEECRTAGVDQQYDAHGYLVLTDDHLATVVLPAEFLDTLSVGEHQLSVFFWDPVGWKNVVFYIEEGTPAEEPEYTYEILDGGNQDYNAEAGGDIVIRIDGPDEEAEEVLVDGTAIGSENYTISHGSTVVTLKEDYLNTLSAGEHKVKVNYSNGAQSEEATITVAETTPDESSESSENSESSTESSASETSNSEPSDSEASNSDTSSSATESSTTSDGGSSDGPKTGDNNGIAAACILMMISMIGIVGVTVLKKKTAAEK